MYWGNDPLETSPLFSLLELKTFLIVTQVVFFRSQLPGQKINKIHSEKRSSIFLKNVFLIFGEIELSYVFSKKNVFLMFQEIDVLSKKDIRSVSSKFVLYIPIFGKNM